MNKDMKPILVFENVSKIYTVDVAALEDVDFVLYEGEFVFLVGPSGAGKSTITRLATLEEKPSHGRILFGDVDTSKLKNSQVYKVRRDIGVVFQNFRLLQNMTVFENMSFILEAMGLPDKEIKDQVDYTLELVGLAKKSKSFPFQLSGGEQQRATIARAVVSQPKLLIADEPTGNLDEENTWDVIQLLNKINSWGTTILVATHNKTVVDSLQRRVIALKNGRLVRDSSGGYAAGKETTKEAKADKATKEVTKEKDKEVVEIKFEKQEKAHDKETNETETDVEKSVTQEEQKISKNAGQDLKKK